MSLSFEPREEDGTPRRFVGMFRPPFEELSNDDWNKAADVTGDYRLRIYFTGRFDAWLRGAADRPLYEAAKP